MDIHSLFLYQEIHEQPDILKGLISANQETFLKLVESIKKKKPQNVLIAARGSSDNAGLYAKYLFGAFNKLIVSLVTPSLFTIYKQFPDISKTLILGISQSGKSPDIHSVLTEGKSQGALTVAITNALDSELADVSDFVLFQNAGNEKSLAATKTYTSQLYLLAALSSYLAEDQKRIDELQNLGSDISEVLLVEADIAESAKRYRYMQHCAVIGRGFNYASAFEFSLKLKELTYTIAEPYSSADFMHGPLALIENGFPVFVIGPSGNMLPEMREFVHIVKKRGADVLAISDDPELLVAAHTKIPLPMSVPEWLSPIPAIIPAQLFAMYLALERNYNPDEPRALSKITKTW